MHTYFSGMKAPHVYTQCRLTKWLLIVALLCSLLACLGEDMTSQNGLPISARTELALATKLIGKQAPPVQKRQRLSTFYTPSESSQFAALMGYNEQVTLQLKVVLLTIFTFTRFAYFIPVKTIPASADGPFSGSRRG